MSKFLKSCAAVMTAAALLSAIPAAVPGADMPAEVTAYAETNGTLSDTVSYTLSDDGKILTISGTGEVPQIRSTISEYNKITSVVIGEGITSIGYRAFYYCYRLKSVEIPNGVTNIGDYAFGDCERLTSVKIPNSVTAIGDYAFHYCSGLTSVEIPNSVTSIGSNAFLYCSGLTSVEIPNSVTSIGRCAFLWCSSLAAINVQDGNSSYYSADGVLFDNNGTLIQYPAGKKAESYSIPNEVTNIGDYAFGNCSGLTSVEIPNGVTNIEGYAFSNCSSLTSVKLPSRVNIYYDSVFNNCSKLTSITAVGSREEASDSILKRNFADLLYFTKANASELEFDSSAATINKDAKAYYVQDAKVSMKNPTWKVELSTNDTRSMATGMQSVTGNITCGLVVYDLGGAAVTSVVLEDGGEK
ncbi:MAG: leucine-rich repeat domain-containing protein [bacterium]|nr:leucine-rich repeat domain-containing protein [bacterium]